MHRFFVPGLVAGSNLEISDLSQIKQITKVLRLSKGGRILVFDGTGLEYESEIVEVGNNSMQLRVIEKKKGIGVVKDVTLYMSLVKKDKFEIITQKVTELGVKKIVPVISQFCVKNEFSAKGLERLRKIVIEAVEQSEGAVIPEIVEPVSFSQALEGLPKKGTVLMAQPRGAGVPFNELEIAEPISVFIGPEGGYSENEVLLAKKHGIMMVSLGARILRAETAAISFLARLLID